VPGDQEVRRDLRRWVPEYQPAAAPALHSVAPATRASWSQTQRADCRWKKAPPGAFRFFYLLRFWYRFGFSNQTIRKKNYASICLKFWAAARWSTSDFRR
jgi:hypothetical protein